MNIMPGIYDDLLLSEFEETERSNPSPRHAVGDQTVYFSRNFKQKKKKKKAHERQALCDFGKARF